MNTGQRLRVLRESLDPAGARAPVGRRTLDYCYPNGTNRWGHMAARSVPRLHVIREWLDRVAAGVCPTCKGTGRR